MILNAKQIIEEAKSNKIIYYSDNKNYLKQNCKNQSVDVNLGEWVYIPLLADRLSVAKANDYSSSTIPQIIDDEWFFNLKRCGDLIIPKGVFFLCHTEQFIGTAANSDILPQFYQRSTIARMGLSHTLAGWGDVGYHNRWAMEFTTLNKFTLKYNMRVGQITFSQTLPNSNSYTSETGNYQSIENDLDDLVNSWKKEDILPREGNY
jgi:deoxycytidine triphosphate deaminase